MFTYFYTINVPFTCLKSVFLLILKLFEFYTQKHVFFYKLFYKRLKIILQNTLENKFCIKELEKNCNIVSIFFTIQSLVVFHIIL